MLSNMSPEFEHNAEYLKRKPLVTVQQETETDIVTGNTERRMFVKMYFEARDSGLLAELPDVLWKTLCCLATYIDEDGRCYPSQSRLARDLGISRQHVNKRIQRLLAFRFNGEPIVSMTKILRGVTDGRWANNIYTLRPISGFTMFNHRRLGTASGTPVLPRGKSMSPFGDTELPEGSMSPPVSEKGDMEKGDTNKTHSLTRRLNVNDSTSSLKSEGSQAHQTRAQQDLLLSEIISTCGDPHSSGFYRLLVREVPPELVRAALSETRHQGAMGKIRKSRGAFFTDEIVRVAKKAGVKLSITRPASES